MVLDDQAGVLAPSHIKVSQPDGLVVSIPTLEVDKACNTLGLFCPAGDGTKHVKQMVVKDEVWLDRLQAKPLPARDAYLSLFLQLYPEMSWGLTTVGMTPNKLV